MSGLRDVYLAKLRVRQGTLLSRRILISTDTPPWPEQPAQGSSKGMEFTHFDEHEHAAMAGAAGKGSSKGMEFTHFDEHGHAIMVDVTEKDVTSRMAAAQGTITVSPECFRKITEGTMEKGDVLGCARIAGIMGAKRTPDLIPLCHILNLTSVKVDFELDEAAHWIRAVCTVRCRGVTGVEMEALTGVSVTLLTIYDMCKAVDKRMEIGQIRLLHKEGGKSGVFDS